MQKTPRQTITIPRDEIVSVLGDQAAGQFLGALRLCLLQYRDARDESARVAQWWAEIDRIEAGFAAFEQAFSGVSEETRDALSGILSPDVRLTNTLDVVRREIDYLFVQRAKSRRGRPTANARRCLARDVAVILDRLGVPLKKARTGQLASILGVVLAVVKDPLPSDPFDVVAQAVDDAVRTRAKTPRARANCST